MATRFPARGPVRQVRALPQRKIDSILTQRERLVAELNDLHKNGHCSKFTENAQQLITRWWCTVNWNGREQLLKTARWQLDLERRHRSGSSSTSPN